VGLQLKINLMITIADFILFCNRTLDGMDALAGRLNAGQLNHKPDLPGANTVFQLVTHATAACEYWVDHIVCGHRTQRDRDSEFESFGSARDLLSTTSKQRTLLAAREEELAKVVDLANEPHTQTPLSRPWTVGAALIHAYEELAQHLGHAEITADLAVRAQAS
jgi:hypothetical protein